jgi:hypothetical protein
MEKEEMVVEVREEERKLHKGQHPHATKTKFHQGDVERTRFVRPNIVNTWCWDLGYRYRRHQLSQNLDCEQ